jgi:hypothetical protein
MEFCEQCYRAAWRQGAAPFRGRKSAGTRDRK